jgi:hypothetical protein
MAEPKRHRLVGARPLAIRRADIREIDSLPDFGPRTQQRRAEETVATVARVKS